MPKRRLDQLPIEILHNIFDNLDIQTIIFSFRYVCKRFYSIIKSYNRYNFNFQFISKPYFRFICQYIPCENVISLTLSNDDITNGQIELFLSLFNIEQFNRLESLTLVQIDNTNLNSFLNYIINSSLKYLSITNKGLNNHQIERSNILSSAIAHRTLQQLCLNISRKDFNHIEWSLNETLRYLSIRNPITVKEYTIILKNYVCLEKLILKDIVASDNEHIEHSLLFEQLKCLIIEDGRIDIRIIEQCVSLTPCLTYLKLIGHGTLFNSTFNGFHWETLIQTKLRLLKKFEFFFSILTYSNYRSRHIELLVNSFQTSFWSDVLHCSITCDYIINSRKIILYTLPISNRYFTYNNDKKKISLSNFTRTINQYDTDYVQNLELILVKDMFLQLSNKSELIKNILFRNVNDLRLITNNEWPTNSIEYLSNIIDYSRIIKLSVSIYVLSEYMSSAILNLKVLFGKLINLNSLILNDCWPVDNCSLRMKTLCSIIPSNIKHLQIRVKNIDDIKYILEKLEYLTSVTFEYPQMLTVNHQELIQSLQYLPRYSSIWNSQYTLHIWLGNRKTIV